MNLYPLNPNGCYYLGDIAAGSDGALWFTTGEGIGRMTTTGLTTQYPLPPQQTAIEWGITTGPDGALWFPESFQVNKIGRLTTAGVLTEYPIPTADSHPTAITLGPDGALWFTEQTVDKIGRITTAGVITEYAVRATPAFGITTGPDGALWFTISGGIGRITTAGLVTFYPVSAQNFGITTGPDGALWFTENNASKIGRITTTGVVTEYATPTPNSYPTKITSGPDGGLWFVETGVAKIGRVTTAGTITEYPIPFTLSYPQGITAGLDGNIWFTDNILCGSGSSFLIGEMVLISDSTKPVSHISSLPPTEPVANFPVHWSGTDVGSGVYAYTIYASDNGGPFALWTWVAQVVGTQANFPGVLGHTYGFYSIAQDKAGNQENPKSAAEATTYVAVAPGDLNGDGAVNCADINVVRSSFGKTVGQPGYNPVADVNHDGVVNVKDLSWVSQYLVPGTQCPQ
jgi:virginiamycin B lyase